ncbi:hypothetical protein T492DRAFT_964999 [Pavlovales sp. CCMP2436]|nr:hypothetical protein T492DRAFT_964999 [Pavlovales sp. CCMP2436]
MGLKPPPQHVGVVSKDKKVTQQTMARISQETFDDAVTENMEELDMELDEAVTDAISQFEAQGIDLSNILKQAPSADRDAHPVLRGLAALANATRAGMDATRELTFGEGSSQSTMKLKFKALPVTAVPEDEEGGETDAGLGQALDALAVACAEEGEAGERSCALLGTREGIDLLSSACLSLLARPELLSALAALGAGLRSTENCEHIGLRGLLALYAVISERPADAPVQAAAFRACAAAMVGNEANRTAMHEKLRIITTAAAALRAHPEHRECVLAACALLRALTLQDDGRVALNKGFDRARAAADMGCLQLLGAQLKRAAGEAAQGGGGEGGADLQMAAEVLRTLSRLCASAKICETLVKLGALVASVSLLQAHLVEADLCRNASGFLANLAGDDEVKSRCGELHVPEIAASVLAGHSESVGTLDACSQLVAALTTRNSPNCAAFLEAGGADALLSAMRRWPQALGLHKRGALVLRNLAVRVPEAVPSILELGAEPVLRADMEKTLELHDLAKAALRDMRCDVSLAQPWQGMPGEERHLERGDDAEDTFGKYMDTDEARSAMRVAGFDTTQF